MALPSSLVLPVLTLRALGERAPVPLSVHPQNVQPARDAGRLMPNEHWSDARRGFSDLTGT